MIICAANQAGKMYGAHWVFQQINFEVHDSERIGLVGANGSGKTTLFKLLAGVESPDHGEIHRRKGANVGYLVQIPDYSEDMTVEEVIRQPFEHLLKMEEQLQACAASMAEVGGPDENELKRLFDRYNTLQEQFERQGGYLIEANIAKVTAGLGIDDAMMAKPFATLSGGEKTKIGLATVLLQEPDLLLLDEPTNHLDLMAIEWLEEFLQKYKGTVMIISHDRYFLDRATTKIFDLEDGELTTYYGNYSNFVKEKEARLLAEFHAYQEQQKKIKKMKETIKRLREWANRANPPNDGLHRRASSMEKALNRIEKLRRPVIDRKKIGLSFEMEKRSGRDVIALQGVAKSFGERNLLRGVNLLIRFKEKAAIVGENGTGKSTIMKFIQGQLHPDRGMVAVGNGVKVGYLSQLGLEGYDQQTVLTAFRDQVSVTEGEARYLLARFLFYGSAVFRKVADLSGGERMRLRLAQLMYQDVNLLLLDEPTNHLDIDSREVFEEALADFPGTIFAISHDRYFLNKLFDKIYWLEHGTLTLYEGNYDWARERRQS